MTKRWLVKSFFIAGFAVGNGQNQHITIYIYIIYMSWTAMTLFGYFGWCLDSGGTICWLNRWLIGGNQPWRALLFY